MSSSGAAAPHPAGTLDARGLSCGALEQLLADRMRRMPAGQVLEVRCDESSARDGIRAWSWLTGNPVVATTPDATGTTRVYLRRK